jgi:hypothetical protein
MYILKNIYISDENSCTIQNPLTAAYTLLIGINVVLYSWIGFKMMSSKFKKHPYPLWMINFLLWGCFQ